MAATPVQPSTQPSLPPMVPILTKLDGDNFLIWKMQVMGTVQAHKLGKFLSDTTSRGMSHKFLHEKDKILGNVFAAFETRKQQDQFIFTWLLASMTPNLHTRMVGM